MNTITEEAKRITITEFIKKKEKEFETQFFVNNGKIPVEEYVDVRIFIHQFAVELIAKVQAHDLQVALECVGEDEEVVVFFRRYDKAPEHVEDWLEKCIQPGTRNELRSEIIAALTKRLTGKEGK